MDQTKSVCTKSRPRRPNRAGDGAPRSAFLRSGMKADRVPTSGWSGCRPFAAKADLRIAGLLATVLQRPLPGPSPTGSFDPT